MYKIKQLTALKIIANVT